MMDLISCYSEYAVQVSGKSSSCMPYTNNSCIPQTLIPSLQIAVTCLYKITINGDPISSSEEEERDIFITVTWCKNNMTQGLHINSGDDPSTAFRLNTNSRLFRKKKGSKSFEINSAKFEVFWDLSAASYSSGPEPVNGYYVIVLVDSELGLFLGDLAEEAAVKKRKRHVAGKSCLVSRREHFSGNAGLYSTRAQFCDSGNQHEIMIRCTGENDGLKYPLLTVCIDKRVVIRVKRLQWNFRGNQTIFVDGLLVDLMWDVHDWFYGQTGSDCGVFMFRTRSGMDSRLWLEEQVSKKDQKIEFSLLIYASKAT